jgi:hypothetical protein
MGTVWGVERWFLEISTVPSAGWGDLVGGDLDLGALVALVVFPVALVEAALNHDPVAPVDAGRPGETPSDVGRKEVLLSDAN